jgi:flavin reductase (DIM6/NTAB) family NADH-FMN oxidoreductase RutF
MDADRLRDAMARAAAGVAVVSAAWAGGWRGLTASSFFSASLEPPLVAVALDRFATTREAVLESGRFNLSLLTPRQRFLAERFSGRAPAVDPAWKDVPHRLGANGVPILEGALAWFECRVQAVHDAGDHDLVLGEVGDAGHAGGDPLILWNRELWSVGRL